MRGKRKRKRKSKRKKIKMKKMGFDFGGEIGRKKEKKKEWITLD